ncbi:uncharacterized protein DSM5745_09760 [Aspergillus mulundensis]|uniref:F-box domain-containing protein n=1 Tax=Aspergillus mulundensis TaxID=1810919 RepID=A0A3D8QRB2_9EURO|nr:hypothetical protein DSM5745_09760 [Aspergillus mulundensis]RDW64349.1 hypothetical protein DSM5745_09760 [Aspergillus mulundensis]
MCVARVRTLDEPQDASWSRIAADLWPDGLHQMWSCSTKETGCQYQLRDELQLNNFIYGEDERDWLRHNAHTFCDWDRERRPQAGDWVPIDPKYKPRPGSMAIHLEDVEHVAGPGCRYPGGYIGKRISVAEMQGCNVVQCLVPKREDWKPAVDDYPFEKDSAHFLSGIRAGLCGRDSTVVVNPIRHGVTEMSHKCPILDPFDFTTDEIPFHPWCFGTWMKLTCSRLGYVPVDDLVKFLESQGTLPFQPVQHHFEGADRSWVYNPGEEWQAANPFYAPKLRNLMERAMDVPSTFTLHDGVFQRTPPKASSDIFSLLPAELRHLVLQYLPSKDIASLRLASRTFHQLPVSLFYRLLIEDMPWLWEIWSDDPPYFWATVTEKNLQDHEKEGIDVHDPYRQGGTTRCVISHTIDVEKHLEQWTYPKPSRYKTNWFTLYCDIKKNWHELKGLRNRKRIWGFQTQLLDLMNWSKDLRT